MTAAGGEAASQNLEVYDGSMASTDGQHVDVMAKAEIGKIGIRLPETGRSKMQNEWPQSERQFFVAKRNLQCMTNGNQQAGSAMEETLGTKTREAAPPQVAVTRDQQRRKLAFTFRVAAIEKVGRQVCARCCLMPFSWSMAVRATKRPDDTCIQAGRSRHQ